MERAKKILKRTLKYTIRGILMFIGVIALYLLTAYLFGKITIEGVSTSEKKEYSVYLLNTGVHTDIVMPAKSDAINWTNTFPISNALEADTASEYLAIGWGDKGFYLETPDWGDLKFSTAFKAAFWLSSSAVHTTYYKDLPTSMEKVELKLSKKQYKKLIKYIKDSVKYGKSSAEFIKTDAVYGKRDAFYEARGTYSFLFTCNTWVNDALKASDQRSCFWTPFAGAIFEKFKK
jgi:uncharacterized protein (TIGR02117 family)